MGTSQSWVARVESSGLDPGFGSVRRYLDAIEAQIDVQPRSSETGFQPMSIADLSRHLRRAAGDGESMLRFCLQFIDDFEEADPGVRATMLEPSPRPTSDPRWDAFLVALTEHLAFHHDMPVPRWVARKDMELTPAWFMSELPSVRAAALAESPAAFRSRGIFVTPDLFDRA